MNGMTTESVTKAASPPRALVGWCLLIGFGCVACLRVARSDSVVFGVSLGLLVVCVVPLLAMLRGKAGGTRSTVGGGGWMRAVTVLLWTALLIGPVVTGGFWAWTRFEGAADGMAELQDTIGLVVMAVVSVSVAYGLAFLAVLIQLWRGQWRARLSAVTVACLFATFMVYVWEMAG